MSSDDQQTVEVSQIGQSEQNLGETLGELSSSADDFQNKLNKLNAAIDELEESMEQLASLKQSESNSLAALADNLSMDSPAGVRTAPTSVAPVADD